MYIYTAHIIWKPLAVALYGLVRPINILITGTAVIFIITACGSNDPKVQVSDRRPPPGEKLTFHIVAKGETLYSIAWRYNLNYKLLAQLNGVDSSYHIFPGQKLSLDPKLSRKKAPNRPNQTAKTTSSAKTAAPLVPPSRSEKESVVARKETQNFTLSSPSKWQWPAKGKLVATFSSNGGLNKGIDIRGNLGEPVYTAAAGSVVYSGSGLRGYGKLVIVKHSEKYLSAYAHNRRLIVKEGDKVKAGDKIAEMGSSGSDTVKLHFEIRYNGKPIDPLSLLPRK